MPAIPENIAIRVELTPEQKQAAATTGVIELNREQALRVRGKVTAAGGAGKFPRGLPMCGCGCGLTLARARQRHPQRAVLLEEE